MNQFYNLVVGVRRGVMGKGKDLTFTCLIAIKLKIPVSYSFPIILPFFLLFLSQLLLGFVGGLGENHGSLFYFSIIHTLV